MADNTTTTYRDILDNNDNNKSYWHNFKPWENPFVGQKACAAYIWDIQQELKHNNEDLINRDIVAEALAKRNVLRQTKTIQITTNLKFLSLEFDTTTTMNTFCQEPLDIVVSCTISFRPDFKKYKQRQPRNYTIVSFFNVPAEVDIQLLIDFLDEYAEIEGSHRYATRLYDNILYKTGTITYKITNLYKDIPRYNKLFGRSIKCYYDGQPQPEKRRKLTEYNSKNEEDHEMDTQIFDNPKNIQDNTESDNEHNTNHINRTNEQQENNKTNQKEKDNDQTNHTLNKDIQNINNKPPTQNVTTRKKQKHNNNQELIIHKDPPDFDKNNFPELTQDKQKNTDNTTIILETPIEQQNEYEGNIEFLLPPLITKKITKNATPAPIYTSTPILNDIDERMNLHQLTIQPKPEHLTRAKKTVNQLHKMGFIDTGCLINAFTFERNYILALAMYYKLGRYDPSEKFILTYKNKDIIAKYKMISEEEIDMTQTLYKIHGHLYNIENRTQKNYLKINLI